MALIRQESLLQYQDNNSGAITASVGRYMHGVIEDYIDGQVLNLTTLINNIQTGASAVGDVEEVQLKGAGNTLLSSPNFKYDLLNSDLLITNSGADFTLPNDESNDFNISIDGTPNTLFTIGGDGNITLGDTDSNITLRRGVTALDENLILEENSLTLNNADFLINSSTDTTANALEVLNSNSDNLLTLANNGYKTRDVNLVADDSNFVTDHGEYTDTYFTFSGTGGSRNISGHTHNVTIEANTSNGQSRYKALYTILNDVGSFTTNYDKVGHWVELIGGGSGTAGYFNNALVVGRLPVYYKAPVDDNRGWVGLVGHGANTGLDINYGHTFGGMQTLLRLKRDDGPLNSTENMLAVGDGIRMSFNLFIDRTVGSPLPGSNDTRSTDYMGVRVSDDTQLAATTEMFFDTTQAGVSVEPLKLTGKDVTIGTTNSNITLQRGTTALDESLELTSESLELTNANMTINGTATDSTSAFTVNNSAGTRRFNVTNDGYILGGTTVARVGFNPSNYTLYQGGSIASFVNGVVRMNLLADSLTLSVPLSVSSITNVNNLTSGAEMIFRSAAGVVTDGFDMRYYAGKGGGATFVSGTVKLGYRQQNNIDVDILTIRERTANSTDGIARIIFAIKEEYADNAAATGAGLPVNTLYKTPTGEVRIVV